MKEVNQLIRISKFLQRLGLFLFVFIWAEAILGFTKYSAPGKLLYREYGVNGMSLYFLAIFVFMFILLAQSKKINDVANAIRNDITAEQNKEKNVTKSKSKFQKNYEAMPKAMQNKLNANFTKLKTKQKENSNIDNLLDEIEKEQNILKAKE